MPTSNDNLDPQVPENNTLEKNIGITFLVYPGTQRAAFLDGFELGIRLMSHRDPNDFFLAEIVMPCGEIYKFPSAISIPTTDFECRCNNPTHVVVRWTELKPH